MKLRNTLLALAVGVLTLLPASARARGSVPTRITRATSNRSTSSRSSATASSGADRLDRTHEHVLRYPSPGTSKGTIVPSDQGVAHG